MLGHLDAITTLVLCFGIHFNAADHCLKLKLNNTKALHFFGLLQHFGIHSLHFIVVVLGYGTAVNVMVWLLSSRHI